MKRFKRAVSVVGVMSVVALLSGATLRAAEQKWVGEISDSACNNKHESGAENVPTPPAKQCTLDCVRGGSKFVLLSGDKVYQIANQNFADLKVRAGEKVSVTGELKGDAITISKMEATQ
jgi:hypothetical protein